MVLLLLPAPHIHQQVFASLKATDRLNARPIGLWGGKQALGWLGGVPAGLTGGAEPQVDDAALLSAK